MQTNRTGIIAAYILLLLFGLGIVFRYSGISLIGMRTTQAAFVKIIDQSGDSQELYEEALRRLGSKADMTKQQEILLPLQNLNAFRTIRQVAGHLLSQPEVTKDKSNRTLLLSMRGTASLETGYLKEGLEDMETAWKLNPTFPGMKNNLAYALVLNKIDIDRAEGLAAQAYNSDNNASNADTLGWITIHQGNFHNGLQLILESVDGSPDSYEVRYHAGIAYWATGDFAKAQAELVIASKLYKAQRHAKNPHFEAALDRVRAKSPFTIEAIP